MNLGNKGEGVASRIPSTEEEHGVETTSLATPSPSLHPSVLRSITAEDALRETAHWYPLTHSLQGEIDPAFKYPLRVKAGKGDKCSEAPTSSFHYTDALFSLSETPTLTGEGFTTIKSPVFGYDVKGEYRHIGRIDFIVLGETGQVLEVGCQCEETLTIFRENIFGRTVSTEDLARQYDANARVLHALRESPGCGASLATFIERRGHEQSWGSDAHLAYYDPAQFNMIAWAKSEGVPLKVLYHAGFLERTVTPQKVTYQARHEPVVFIPFRDNESQIVLWRMRLVHPKEGEPKYRSAPLDRADRIPETVYRQLYNAELLSSVGGKPLIITEGEFKCLVTTKLTGITTVGITGITQVTDLIIDEIVRAGPSRIVVILDRDPKAKGLERVDALTDSERAAYLIAQRLQRAGHNDVVVGTLPDHFNGGKCGIDDLLLDIERERVTSAIKRVMKESMPPDDWLMQRGADPRLQELFARRQRVNQVLRDFSNHVHRSPEYAQDSACSILAHEQIAELTRMSATLEGAFRLHLANDHCGARRLNQPPRKLWTLYNARGIHNHDSKMILLQSGASYPIKEFTRSIIVLRGHSSDLPYQQRLKEVTGIEFPFSMKDLTKMHQDPGKVFTKARTLYDAGYVLLNPGVPIPEIASIPYTEFVTNVFAGFLARVYPPDEYRFERDLRLIFRHATYSEQVASIPLALFKHDGTPVAFCCLPVWRDDGHKATRHRAALCEARSRAAVKAFLRNPQLITQRAQGERIAALAAEASDTETHRSLTPRLLPGIDPSTYSSLRLRFITQDVWDRLKSTLTDEKLLNQATQLGLFIEDDEGFCMPRFEGSTVLVEDRDSHGAFRSFLALPLFYRDRLLGALPPVPKQLFSLDGPRSTTKAFDARGTFFLPAPLADAEGKEVIIVPDEYSALVLHSFLSTRGITNRYVIGLREFDNVTQDAYAQLLSAMPASVTFLGQEVSADSLSLRYASYPLQDPFTHAAECKRAVGSHDKVGISVCTLSRSVREEVEAALASPESAKSFTARLTGYKVLGDLRNIGVARQRFSKLLSLIEKNRHDFSLDEDAEIGRSSNKSACTAILRKWLEDACVSFHSLEELLCFRYGVERDAALDTLFHGDHTVLFHPRARIPLQPSPLVAEDIMAAHGARFLTAQVLEIENNERHAMPQREGPALSAHLCSLVTSSLSQLNGQKAVKSHVTSVKVLGFTFYEISLSLAAFGEMVTVHDIGDDKKKISASALQKAMQDLLEKAPHSELAKLVSKWESRLEIERSVCARGAARDLHQFVAALQKGGVAISITKGKVSRSSHKTLYSVSWQIQIDGLSWQEAPVEASTATAAEHVMAARVLLGLREKFKDWVPASSSESEGKRKGSVTGELNNLARKLGAVLSQPDFTLTGEVPEQQHLIAWPLEFRGERFLGHGEGRSKNAARADAATGMLNWLRGRDEISRASAWS